MKENHSLGPGAAWMRVQTVAVGCLLPIVTAGWSAPAGGQSFLPPASSPSVAAGMQASQPSIKPAPAHADTNGLSTWSRPRSEERSEQRLAMVRNQIAARGVKDPAVLAAMRNVPRHWFVPDRLQEFAYADRPLPIGERQTISQPYIVALMTEALRLTPESRVLEVGTGSGYQAAVLAEITPHVYTIEIVEPLGKQAMALFARRGYGSIRARVGDGYRGWPKFSPFDAIIVTCAPDHIPPPLIEQLVKGGRICIPVGSQRGVQKLVVVTRQEDGTVAQSTLIPVRFVPMTGKALTGDTQRD